MASARETSYFRGSKSTFRDSCKGSERLDFNHADFVAGTVLWTWWWSSTRPDFVTGAVNRDFWRCGWFAGFVAGAAW